MVKNTFFVISLTKKDVKFKMSPKFIFKVNKASIVLLSNLNLYEVTLLGN